jgi:hypothetical protein
MPDLSKVIATATLRDNAAASNTDHVPISCTWDFDRPILLQANKQYAVVVKASDTWNVYYGDNHDPNGSVFYTQDASYWNADLQKDLSYELVVANFGDLTEWEFELNHVSMEGGVGSLSYDQVAELAVGTDIQFLVQLNDQWIDIAQLDVLQQRPAYFPVKARLTGNQYLFPLLDTVNSRLTVFRPDTSVRFISVNFPLESDKLTISYTVRGFETEYHTFTPSLKLDDSTVVEPVLLDSDMSGNIAKFTATFEGLSGTTYRHDLNGATLTPTKVFEVAEIMEIK